MLHFVGIVLLILLSMIGGLYIWTFFDDGKYDVS
jgi:hypothetical protein